MKIVLSGASGFLGKVIYDLIILDNSVDRIGRVKGEILCDLLCKIPSINNCDLMIHVAGVAHVNPKTEEENLKLYKDNVLITENLLSGLSNLKLKPSKFVFISSVSVYGINEGLDINEDYQLKANSLYGLSKIASENLIKEWCLKFNVKCTILRLPLIVGINPPGNLSSMINGIRRNYYFNIAGGYARKSMVLASDVAKNILKAAEVGGTYNLTDGYHPSFRELSQYIAENFEKTIIPNLPRFVAIFFAIIGDNLGSNFPINSVVLKKITSTLTFDDSKARKAFYWEPTPVLKGFKLK